MTQHSTSRKIDQDPRGDNRRIGRKMKLSKFLVLSTVLACSMLLIIAPSNARAGGGVTVTTSGSTARDHRNGAPEGGVTVTSNGGPRNCVKSAFGGPCAGRVGSDIQKGIDKLEGKDPRDHRK